MGEALETASTRLGVRQTRPLAADRPLNSCYPSPLVVSATLREELRRKDAIPLESMLDCPLYPPLGGFVIAIILDTFEDLAPCRATRARRRGFGYLRQELLAWGRNR
jgi:hypothetical protein